MKRLKIMVIVVITFLLSSTAVLAAITIDSGQRIAKLNHAKPIVRAKNARAAALARQRGRQMTSAKSQRGGKH